MARSERVWHPNFLKYMHDIVNHPNYDGLPISIKKDGSYSWIATAKSEIGQERIRWCLEKAAELGIPDQPGVYADVMLNIHPTKWKVWLILCTSFGIFLNTAPKMAKHFL